MHAPALAPGRATRCLPPRGKLATGGTAAPPRVRRSCPSTGRRAHTPATHSRPATPPGRFPDPCRSTQRSTDAAASAAPAPPASLRGLVFGAGPAGAWDDGGLGAPVVRCYVGDNEQRWYLWYSARSAGPPADGRVIPPPAADAVAPGAGAVGLARSADGVTWTRGPGADTPWAASTGGAGGSGAAASSSPPPVLGPNPDDWWWHDTAHVSVSDVQILSSGGVAAGAGVYWMFYAGGCWERAAPPPGLPLPPAAAAEASGGGGDRDTPADGALEGLRTRAGLALSQDGVHWARVEGADHPTGAVLDAADGDGASSSSWDAAFVGAPQVVAAGPRDLRLYYHSFDSGTGKWTVGVARSPDGLKWERWGGSSPSGIFSGGGHAHDAGGAAARHVVRDAASGGWVMAYEGVASDGRTRSIGLAFSADGLTGWTAAPSPALTPGDPGAWDAGGVGGPCLVPMAGGRWRLYYSGRREGEGAVDGRWCGVGLALSEDGGEGLEGAPSFPARFVRREGAVPEGVAPVAAA